MSHEHELDRRIDAAARAYAHETAAPSEGAERTRARVLASHRARRAQARTTAWLAAAAAVVIVLGGSTAWAYWSGRLASWMGTTEPTTTPAASPAPPPPAAPSPRPAHEAPSVPPPPPVPVLDPAPAGDPAAIDSASDAPEASVDPAERLAYRRAHALHFDAHDAAGALSAWDAYLATYPRGRFALEARYNRALCLVRLERRDEAERALAPFAEGTHGDYRRDEARALLEALRSE
jgi:hypothetical protein